MKLIHKMPVYKQATRTCTPVLRPDAVFAPLTAEDIHTCRGPCQDHHARQVDRFSRFGGSFAYGAFIDSELAAFAWLLPHDIMRKDVPKILTGKAGEAEITAAETLPKFRGRGLHSFVIRNIFAAARETGITTVFLKTFPTNESALKSFQKTGAARAGTTYFAFLPGLRNPVVWPRHF